MKATLTEKEIIDILKDHISKEMPDYEILEYEFIDTQIKGCPVNDLNFEFKITKKEATK